MGKNAKVHGMFGMRLGGVDWHQNLPALRPTGSGVQASIKGIVVVHATAPFYWSVSLWQSKLIRDNIFVERLWRSIKYEEVYLHAYESVSVARQGIDRYLTSYNTRTPHSSLDGQTPDQAYQIKPQPIPVAA